MESHKAGFPPFPHSLEIPSGFPHYHGLDGGLGLGATAKTSHNRNSSPQLRKGLVTDVPGPKCNGCSGTLSPFHVFLQVLSARSLGPRLFLYQGSCFVLSSPCIGNRAAFSDSRSNFHTRVGYRTNVCRRRLASDLARASGCTPAQGALEDHHDLPPGSPKQGGGAAQTQAVIGTLISRPMAQIKPASSLAIAATTTVDFLPLATRER